MDDPWADAPPSPSRGTTPTAPSTPTSPSLVQSSASVTSPLTSPKAAARSTPSSPLVPSSATVGNEEDEGEDEDEEATEEATEEAEPKANGQDHEVEEVEELAPAEEDSQDAEPVHAEIVPAIEEEVAPEPKADADSMEPAVEPAVETAVEPVIEPVVEPAVEPVVDPVVEPVIEPVIEPTPETEQAETDTPEFATPEDTTPAEEVPEATHEPVPELEQAQEHDTTAAEVAVAPSERAFSDDMDFDATEDEEADEAFTSPFPAASGSALPAETERAVDAFDDDGFGGDDGFGAAPAAGGDDGFGDFDNFDAAGPSGGFDDDDGFGDFGDFAEGDDAFAAAPVQEEVVAGPSVPAEERWAALELRPVPRGRELFERLATVLAPILPDSEAFTDEEPRAVGGLSQVLATESSRDAYAQLTTAPMLKPLDWTRSRVRRDHLISMGVPVNLDEVDSHRLSALPPLRITTGLANAPPPRAQSADPAKGKAREDVGGMGSAPASAVPSSNFNSENERKYGLGPRPGLDVARAEDLCGLEEDQLALYPLARLEALHADLVRRTADASGLLAWFLQLKDAQTHDQATYNGMISELIANAAKVKQSSGGGGLFRRQSTQTPKRPMSLSASTTPRRSASPAAF